MSFDSQKDPAIYSLLKYGIKEYPQVVDYHPSVVDIKSAEEKVHYIAAKINGAYISWSRTIPSGLVDIAGETYLSIPNGWDGRLRYYPWYCGHRYWQYSQWSYPTTNIDNSGTTRDGANISRSNYEYIHGNESNSLIYNNNNQFTDKLLIYWKKTPSVIPDSANINLTSLYKYTENVDSTLLARYIIYVRDANSVVDFEFYGCDNSATIDFYFGDGDVEHIHPVINRLVVSHTYALPGEYIVDIHGVSGLLGANFILEAVHHKAEVYNNMLPSNEQNAIRYAYYYYNVHSVIDNDHGRFYAVTFNCSHQVNVLVCNVRGNDTADMSVNKCNLNLVTYTCRDVYICSDYVDTVLISGGDSVITNIYFDPKITIIDFSGCNNFTINNVYIYSIDVVDILSYNDYDPIADNVTYVSLMSTNFHVRSSILSDMQRKYPALNFSTL